MRPAVWPRAAISRHLQLGCFALPLALGAVLVTDRAAVIERGLLQGFDGVVWLIVILNGLGGLLVAATMKVST